jgi:hypothetical protein
MRHWLATRAPGVDAAPVAASATTSVQLRGRWLLTAPGAWLLIAATTLCLFAASVPAQLTVARSVCPTDICASGQSLATVHALHSVGLSLDLYAATIVTLNIIFASVYALVGILLFWRRSGDRMALLASIALLTFGASAFTGALDPLAQEHPAWLLPVAAVNFTGSATFILLLYVFPDARFAPRAMRWRRSHSWCSNCPTTSFRFPPPMRAPGPSYPR